MREEETCDAWGLLGAMILERRIRTRRGLGPLWPVGPTECSNHMCVKPRRSQRLSKTSYINDTFTFLLYLLYIYVLLSFKFIVFKG
jgi:hypothetical protein